jgi:hypothetical protein
MGYDTEFDEGEFEVTPKLSKEMYEYLMKFNQTRRMARRVSPIYGIEGEFYVDGKTSMQDDDEESNIIDYNKPPNTQPGLWCQWKPNEDGTAIVWDQGEKFYEFESWLKYLIDKILAPNGYKVNGVIRWRGEEFEDVGALKVVNNKVTSKLVKW